MAVACWTRGQCTLREREAEDTRSCEERDDRVHDDAVLLQVGNGLVLQDAEHVAVAQQTGERLPPDARSLRVGEKGGELGGEEALYALQRYQTRIREREREAVGDRGILRVATIRKPYELHAQQRDQQQRRDLQTVPVVALVGHRGEVAEAVGMHLQVLSLDLDFLFPQLLDRELVYPAIHQEGLHVAEDQAGGIFQTERQLRVGDEPFSYIVQNVDQAVVRLRMIRKTNTYATRRRRIHVALRYGHEETPARADLLRDGIQVTAVPHAAESHELRPLRQSRLCVADGPLGHLRRLAKQILHELAGVRVAGVGDGLHLR